MRHTSAGAVRAGLERAARLHEAKLLAGMDDEESAEAEAGAILIAETSNNIDALREMVAGWMKAQSKG